MQLLSLLSYTNVLWVLLFLAMGFFPSWGIISFILSRPGREIIGRGKDFHHTHKTPVPRLGGAALAISFALVSLGIFLSGTLTASNAYTLGVIILSSLAMFALGFWDDFRPLGAKIKLLSQIAIAAAVYFSDVRIGLFKNPLTDQFLDLGVLGFFATVIWLVALTNLINLIDGIDGLAGGICLMLMFLLANLGGGEAGFVGLLSIGVAGALLGFLKFNYPPAKIYMGDGGAYFLGFLIGLLSIVSSDKGSVAAALIAPAFALALPLVDVSLAILRRGLRGLPLFRPDQKHIHHHLINLGISRERAVKGLYAVSLFCLVLAFGVFYMQGRLLPLFAGLLFLLLLVSGHLSGFTKNWFTIGSRLGQSLALRKETRYALVLGQWLEMEVERHNSVSELWQDYQFVVKKLGFSRVKMVLPDSAKTWQRDSYDERSVEIQHSCHDLSDGTVIELAADKTVMSEMLYSLLSDLAAEAWYKAAARWRTLNKAPVEFGSLATPAGNSEPKKFTRLYTPLERKSSDSDCAFSQSSLETLSNL